MIELPYDLMRRKIELHLRKGLLLKVAEPSPLHGAAPEAEAERALSSPEFTAALKRGLSRGDKAVVLIDDHTRPTPTKRVLPKVLEKLERFQEVTVIYARGTHETPTQELLEMKVSREVMDSYPVIIHNAYNHRLHYYVGLTRLGTPVWVSSELQDAALVIGVGSIFPSELAGFTGGCKIAVPGAACYRTINTNHRLCLSPNADYGILEGNPLREDIDEAGKLAGLSFILDFVLDLRTGKAKAFYGDPVQAHRAGAKLSAEVYRVSAPRADAVLASPGAHEDIDFCQALKAICAADEYCTRGGTIVLFASCPLGVAWPELSSLLKEAREEGWSREEILLQACSSDYEAIAAYIAYRLYHLLVKREKRLIVVSDNLSESDLKEFGAEVYRDPQEAVDEATRGAKDRSVLVLKSAGCVWPLVE